LLPLKDNIPTRNFPVVTVAIIVINVVVFIFFQQALFGPNGGFNSSGDETKVIEYSFIPYELSHPGKNCGALEGSIVCEKEAGGLDQSGARPGDSQAPVWLTIFTSMFMHGGVLHIAGNMLFLWIFGNNIEDAMGRLKFILFYLAGGVVAALTHFFIGGPNEITPTLGASGAIAAVLGGYALLYPKARVVTLVIIIFFITVITLPALLVLGLWFLLQLLDASSQPLTGGGVAVWAHIGGFVFGLLTVKLLATHYDAGYERYDARRAVY
jgi:membrane associated rhomboid family serine protease